MIQEMLEGFRAFLMAQHRGWLWGRSKKKESPTEHPRTPTTPRDIPRDAFTLEEGRKTSPLPNLKTETSMCREKVLPGKADRDIFFSLHKDSQEGSFQGFYPSAMGDHPHQAPSLGIPSQVPFYDFPPPKAPSLGIPSPQVFPYILLDLTHNLHESIPTWPGTCGFHQKVEVDYGDCEEDYKFRVMELRMHGGIGTHMDAPSHCFPGARFVHDFTLQELCMPCVVLDVSKKIWGKAQAPVVEGIHRVERTRERITGEGKAQDKAHEKVRELWKDLDVPREACFKREGAQENRGKIRDLVLMEEGGYRERQAKGEGGGNRSSLMPQSGVSQGGKQKEGRGHGEDKVRKEAGEETEDKGQINRFAEEADLGYQGKRKDGIVEAMRMAPRVKAQTPEIRKFLGLNKGIASGGKIRDQGKLIRSHKASARAPVVDGCLSDKDKKSGGEKKDHPPQEILKEARAPVVDGCLSDKDKEYGTAVQQGKAIFGQNYQVTVQDLLDFESTYGLIPEGSCVMIHTGWGRLWEDPEKYRNDLIFPSVSVEAAHILLDRGVLALGIDTLSADTPEKGFPVHYAFLGQGKILIENVAHLDAMPPVGGFVMVLPIKIKDGTEAPLRLVGLVMSMEEGEATVRGSGF